MTNTVQNSAVHNQVQSQTQNQGAAHMQHNVSWKGFKVQNLPKGATQAANMAEEVALSVASLKADKSVKKKQVEEKKDKKVSASQELMPGMPLYEAEIFAKAFAQSHQKDAASALELVKKFFKDPSLQDTALRFVQERLAEKDPQHDVLIQARKILNEQEGSQIRAGYNIATISHPDFTPQQSRDCYRFHALNYKNYEETFKNLLKDNNSKNLEQTVDFLRKALGVDMQALEPSCAPAKLQEVAEGLYVVQNLNNLYAQAEKLCTASEKRFKLKEPQAKQVMESMLHIKDNRNLTETYLRSKLPFLASKNPSRDAVFVRGVREIMRNMPLKLYFSEEQRQKVLNVLQLNLDMAIDREDEQEV